MWALGEYSPFLQECWALPSCADEREIHSLWGETPALRDCPGEGEAFTDPLLPQMLTRASPDLPPMPVTILCPVVPPSSSFPP